MEEEVEHGGIKVGICQHFLQCIIRHKSAEVEEVVEEQSGI